MKQKLFFTAILTALCVLCVCGCQQPVVVNDIVNCPIRPDAIPSPVKASFDHLHPGTVIEKAEISSFNGKDTEYLLYFRAADRQLWVEGLNPDGARMTAPHATVQMDHL